MAAVSKQKDGEMGAEFGFTLDVVVLGVDEDGDEITSCAVTHQAHAVTKRMRAPKGAHEKTVMTVMGELKQQDRLPVTVTELIDLAKARTDVTAKRDQRNFLIDRAIRALHKVDLIRIDGVMIDFME